MKRNRKKNKAKRPRGGIRTSSPAEIDKMRAAGRLASEILDRVAVEIRPGVTTADIERLVVESDPLARRQQRPSAMAPGFPGHCCTSVNDVVCHGIPDDAASSRTATSSTST